MGKYVFRGDKQGMWVDKVERDQHWVDRISPMDNIPRRAFQAEERAHGKVSRHETAWPIWVSMSVSKNKE